MSVPFRSSAPATSLLHVLLALTCVCSVACDDTVESTRPVIESTGELDPSWLLAATVPFDTDAPDADDADLEPLKAIIGDARVVALGEQTHGTREFFRMKHRLLRFLVREMGFTTFGIEATWGESNHIDDYVRSGAGDAAELLANLHFWTWNTREVLDMIEWMRVHNENPGGAPEVGFHGFDMQYYRVAMDDVEAYVQKVDPAALPFVTDGYGCYRFYQDQPPGYPWRRYAFYAAAPDSVKARCREGVRVVHDTLAARRDRYEAASSRGEFAHALRAARVVVQNETMLAIPDERVLRREQYMAENAAWIVDQAGPEGKVVLWAHNGHVRDARGAMGRYLRDRFGTDLVVVGFAFNEGSITAVRWNGGGWSGLGTHEVDPAPVGSYEHEFSRAGRPRFILDLRALEEAPQEVAEWMRGPRPFRAIGCCYDPRFNYMYSTPLSDQFDAIIYFELSTPTEVLPTPQG